MVKKLWVLAMVATFVVSATSAVYADSELSSKNNQVVLVQQEGNVKNLWNLYLKNNVPASDFSKHQIDLIEDYITTDDFLMGVHHFTKTELNKLKLMFKVIHAQQ
jgi:hypothetical protein